MQYVKLKTAQAINLCCFAGLLLIFFDLTLHQFQQ